MDLKAFFVKKLMFQNSLKDSDVWTQEKFDLFPDIPASPSNDEAMVGFIRHITMFTHEQRDYLTNKVSIPVGIQQRYQLLLEDALTPLWKNKSNNSQATHREIVNKDKALFPEISLLNPLLEKLLLTHTVNAKEVGLKTVKDKKIIAEIHFIDLFANHLAQHLSGYNEFLEYLFINKKLDSIIIDENKNRYFILLTKD